MIYIASAFISFFITTSLLVTALYLKLLYYKVLNSTTEFMKAIIKSLNEKR